MMQKVTLKQVAQRAGFSYQTVSKVLNKQIRVTKETEDRILEAAHLLGYKPNIMARNMRQGRTRLIGYSWPPVPQDQISPILDHLLQGMAEEAEKNGYHVVCFPHQTGKELLSIYEELIGTRLVDAFVISSVEYDDPRILYLKNHGFPFAAFGRSNPDWDIPYVDVDGASGTQELVNHLVDLGHRRIAALAWPPESRVGQNRMDGLLQGLQDAGLEPLEIIRGEGNAQFGRQAARELLSRPEQQRPTAMIGFNDFMAIGAMQAAQEMGFRVGENLAIAGFDDSPISQYLNPALTSVRQPILQVGKQVISLLVSLLENETPDPVPPRQILLKPELVIRSSTQKQ
jgi:DNA-binding LacI/PurR family transcriptional regulator